MKNLTISCLLWASFVLPAAADTQQNASAAMAPASASSPAQPARGTTPAGALLHQPLIVGIKVAPPFVIEDHGHYRDWRSTCGRR